MWVDNLYILLLVMYGGGGSVVNMSYNCLHTTLKELLHGPQIAIISFSCAQTFACLYTYFNTVLSWVKSIVATIWQPSNHINTQYSLNKTVWSVLPNLCSPFQVHLNVLMDPVSRRIKFVTSRTIANCVMTRRTVEHVHSISTQTVRSMIHMVFMHLCF